MTNKDRKAQYELCKAIAALITVQHQVWSETAEKNYTFEEDPMWKLRAYAWMTASKLETED